MKIALVTDRFNVGGGLEYLYQTVKAMKEVNFIVFGKGGPARRKFYNLDNVELFDKGYRPHQILKAGPDLIHFHHLRPLFEFYMNPLAKYQGPIIFTAHGLHIHKYEYMRGLINRTKGILRSVLEKYLLRRVNRVIAVSGEDHVFLKEKYNLENTVNITYGINVDELKKIQTSKKRLSQELNIPLDSQLFLTVARFDFQKGYDILIKAINIGQREFRQNNVKFVLVGDGEELKEIKRLAESGKLTDLVRFMGARDDSYALMKASDLFVLPSRWEGLPISLIEASFCNLPIVASDTCGSREIVADGYNGYLFTNEEPDDLCKVLLSIINDKLLEKRAPGSYNKAFINKYDISSATMKLRKLYEESIAFP